ncbi:MAG: 6-bladed beta-propeller [Candidatus Aminicenantes bacterium]|nr:6-bladed beta-propeller [Candidatus Aminicenantes bacterium]
MAITALSARPNNSSEAQPLLTLKPDLTIGVEDGDEKLMFGSISRIDLNDKGDIFILDYKYRKISVFDRDGHYLRTILVPAGQGPQEATNLSGIAVTPSGRLYVNDMRKVIVYGPDGRFERSFLVDFMISSIGCPGTESLVAIGSNRGKILHTFDPTGKLLDSFGDPFPVPAEFEALKDMPMFRAPILFDCSKDGKIFVLNPSKYEVTVFQANHVEQDIRGESALFKPVQRMGRGFVSTAAHIIKSGDYVLVAFQNPDRKAQKKMDIFKAGQQVGSMDISGTPFVVDAQGRIYFAEEEEFPKVRRYIIER